MFFGTISKIIRGLLLFYVKTLTSAGHLLSTYGLRPKRLGGGVPTYYVRRHSSLLRL